MLTFIYAILAVIGTVVTAWLTPCSWLLTPLLALGYLVGLMILHLVVALIISLFVYKNRPVARVGRFWHFMTVQTVDCILKVAGVRLHITGEELLPQDRRFMLVSNHLSRFDPMICMVRFRRTPLAFVSKPGNFKIPLAGAFIHKCGYLSIDRENARNALTTLNTATEYISSGRLSVGIYPEGTRSKTGELLEFKDGVFKIARDSHAPIVVMTVSGTENITHNFPFRPTHVDMHIVRVIQPEEYAGMRTGAISSMVRKYMEDDLATQDRKNQNDTTAAVIS